MSEQNELIDNLVEAMRANNVEGKPKVDDLAKMAGVDKVTGAERDEAYAIYSNAGSEEVEAIFVRSRRPHNFRRAGFEFTPEGLGIAKDALTEAQLKAIVSEPLLLVEHCTLTADELTTINEK